MVNAELGADPAGGGGEGGQVGEEEGYERGVEIVDGREGVEGAFGEGAFGAGAGGGGGFAGEAGDEVHEGLGHFLVVDGVEHAEGADAFFGRVEAAAHEHGADRVGEGLAGGDTAVEAGGDAGEGGGAGVEQVGTNLEVAGVFGGFAVHDTGVGGQHDEGGLGGGDEVADEFLDRVGVGVEAEGVVEEFGGFGVGDGGVVGEEGAAGGEVAFGVFIVAADDGIVGALEEAGFAVVDDFDRGAFGGVGREALDGGGGGDGGGGDVVLGLDLDGRKEVAAQGEGAPGAVGGVADAEELGGGAGTVIL